MIGRRLAHYEITGALGRGGMGEVYRAHDTTLDRDVAIKVLPEDLANDPERRARFEREARTLASLNHANVAQIHGLDEADGTRFLVMELVEGLDLQKRIKDTGAFEPDEAIAIAVQIAAGLEAAHDQGVVHRDLKPANVMLTEDGQVKILDFGLARAFADGTVDEDPALSPTITAAMTQAGTVLGTAAYMSPEQARGKTVDRRADIWAFGVIVWEMLTGTQLFAGETISDTLAGVLKQPIDFESLGDAAPPNVRYVLERCLDRNPSRRLRDIGEARLVLSGEATGVGMSAVHGDDPAASRARAREITAWVLVGILAVVAGLLTIRTDRPADSPTSTKSVNATLELGRDLQLSSEGGCAIAISDDGRTIVVSATDRSAGGTIGLYRRAIDGTTFERIEGTENASDPAFSPDGRSLLFNRYSFQMHRIGLEGGPATMLGRGDSFGMCWTADDSIFYTASYAGGLTIRSAEGGPGRTATDPTADEKVLGHWHPDDVTGTPWILFTSYASPGDSSRIIAWNRDDGTQLVVVEGARFARWAESGHVLFIRQNQLMALPVDRETMTASGRAATILPDMSMDATDGFSELAISAEGTLVYMDAAEASFGTRLTVIRRDGTTETMEEARHAYLTPRLSPDGRYLAVARGNSNRDLWLLERARGAWTRLTFDLTSEFGPVWSPDGQWIYFARESPAFNIYRIRPLGSADPELVVASGLDHTPVEVLADGSILAVVGTVERSLDIVRIDADGTRTDLRSSPYLDAEPRLSPDRNWLAFTSNESGELQVYVQAYPDGSTRVPISIGGGQESSWASDGRSLYFRDDDTLYEVAIEVDERGIRAGRPEKLWTVPFEQNWYTANYDVLPDDSGVIAIVPDTERGRRRITVITDFFAELERRAPADR